MHTGSIGNRLASYQRQNLLLEYSSLRHAHLDGTYVSVTSGDPTLWVGVIFVRKGPYAPAVLRFQIVFPPSYPSVPPLVMFSTDIFHPLLTPLTTYTYTTGATDADTVSATDQDRLPPGGFSLRHGFPQWFRRARADTNTSRHTNETADEQKPGEGGQAQSGRSGIPCVAEVLKYIQGAFSEESVLDSIPLAAAANPGAFHAWRTHRGEDDTSNPSSSPSSRRPGQWNWEGVWEDRVKKGIRTSLSEQSLFAGGADEINFLELDSDTAGRVKNDVMTPAPVS